MTMNEKTWDRVTMTAEELSAKLKKWMPAAAVIEWTCQNCGPKRGVALSLGENLTRVWQSGDVIVFWQDGDHTALYDKHLGDIQPDTKITVLEWVFAFDYEDDDGQDEHDETV